MSILESAAAFLAAQVERLRQLKPQRRIVFPEGDDPRVQAAADRLQREGLVTPILLKARRAVPQEDARKDARAYFELPRAKGLTAVETAVVTKQPRFTTAPIVAGASRGRF